MKRKIVTQSFGVLPDDEKRLRIDTKIFQSGWNELGNELLYYRPGDTTLFASKKAVLFDIDGTIIKTKSGNRFPGKFLNV